jgi:hypothetical protein
MRGSLSYLHRAHYYAMALTLAYAGGRSVDQAIARRELQNLLPAAYGAMKTLATGETGTLAYAAAYQPQILDCLPRGLRCLRLLNTAAAEVREYLDLWVRNDWIAVQSARSAAGEAHFTRSARL